MLNGGQVAFATCLIPRERKTMKRLLSTTTVLSLALAPVQPWPLMAQAIELTVAEDGSVLAPDGSILCAPTAEEPCDLEALTEQFEAGLGGLLSTEAAEAQAAAEAAAAAAAIAEQEAEAAAASAAEAAAEAEAAAAQEAANAAAAAAEEAARAAAEAEANAAREAADAQAAAEEAARAAAEAASEAERNAEAAIAAEAEARAAAEAEAAAAASAADATQNSATAAGEAADAAADSEAAATDAASRAATDAEGARTAADGTADVDAAAEAEAAATAEAEAAAAAADAEAAANAEAEAAAAAEAAEATPAPDAPVPAEETEAPDAAADTTTEAEAAPVAEAPVAPEEPVEAPVVSEDETRSLINLLAAPLSTDAESDASLPAVAAAAAAGLIAAQTTGDGTQAPAEQPAAEPQDVTVTTLTESDTRSSAEEFTAAPTTVEGNRRSGLSNLEKVGLLALGALVVGAVLNDGREVVENTGDRVVVRDPQGNLSVYKDDDTLLRRPGSTVRTETFRDGSTRTTVDRTDGAQVVTIRDASGRVLRRATYDSRGNEIVLIDDLEPEVRIDVTTLPRPRADRLVISTNDGNAALTAALAREEARNLGRTFSLRQIREIAQVRALAATIDVDNVTFDSGSAVIRPSEARKLASIGRIMTDILRENPGEVFLIEGHTDAVGSASYNLTLSDRRAESVALALTEYYGIAPENMVVQGYGESELRVPTQADERRNRRAVIRVITPLMRSAELR
jgi:outer membrane protein OmpA-like peptidoglycan-associated protein